MQTKSIFTVIISLLLSFVATAQTHNPYKDIGKKGKVLTLTHGEYDEFFDEDSIQRIGSAFVNINSMKVVKVNLNKEEQRQLNNSQVSRFLSIDPLANRYPMLTPYQYASNRPIDGIDMDGLEYLTYTIAINKTTSKITSQTYNWVSNTQNNIHGNMGQGVLYDIRMYDEKKKSWSFNSVFVSRSGILGLGVDEYGNYMGSTALLEVGVNGKFKDKRFDYTLPAVDAVDNLAKQHDIGYDRVNAIGASGLFNDLGTTPYDEAALKGWDDLQANYKVGDKDPFNNQSMTKDEFSAAYHGATLFRGVVESKKRDIALFMANNYKNEAAQGKMLSSKYGLTFSNDEIGKNYNLFLNKYMQKDEEGNWKRNNSMWNTDKKGNFTTPKKPGK